MAEELKILIVTDKFKGSLTAKEAAECIRKGLFQGLFGHGINHDIKIFPMADGGEGTLDVIKKSKRGELIYTEVCDPLLRPVRTPYLLIKDKAFIEMAKCCGLQLLNENEYDPHKTSTYGLGQMILAAIEGSCAKDIVIGIGGSATNDGGMGMLRALGYRFYDYKGNETIFPGQIKKIDGTKVTHILKNVRFMVASDVNNPLLGERGATMVYGPQKGAGENMLEELEREMKNYATVCEEYLGKDYSNLPGAGAAGGVGFALTAFLGAELVPGWKVLSEFSNLEKIIKESDLIITGEGSIDEQSISGKLIDGITQIARKHGKRLWAYCGVNKLNERQISATGIEKIFAISDIESDRYRSMRGAKKYLERISFESATFLNNFQSNRQTD